MEPHQPELQFSKSTDTTIAAKENSQYRMIFKTQIERYEARKETYEANLLKAYDLLWGQCAKNLQYTILDRIDFEKEIKHDPIKLLKVIKEHAIDYQETRYASSVYLDALENFISTKQRDGESLIEYTGRLRTAHDVLTSHNGGPLVFFKGAKQINKEYDSLDTKQRGEIHEKVWNEFVAYLFLRNADQSKYGSMLKELKHQQALKNDQYPKTLTNATEVLSSRSFDQGYHKKQKHKKSKSKYDETKRGDEESPAISFAQFERKGNICFCCGKKGHKSPQCKGKDRPRSEWAIHKSLQTGDQQSHAQAANTTQQTSEATVSDLTKESNQISYTQWNFAHISESDDMRNKILLDSQSTVSLFCNPNLVSNIRETNETLILRTNAGRLRTNLKATVKNWGDVWFSTEAITNIFSNAEVRKRYDIVYDTREECAYRVYLPDRVVKFTENEAGLHVHTPDVINTNEQRQFVNRGHGGDLKLPHYY